MEEAIDKNTVPETAEDSLYQEKDEDNETSDVKDERDEKDGEDNETSDVKDERGTPLEDEIASNASESNKGEKDENKDEAEDEDEEIPEDDNEEGVEEISNSGDNNAVAETSNDKRENAEEGKDENKEVEDTTENSNVAEEEKQTSENIEHNRNDKDENEKEDQTSPASESFQEESESKTSPNNENDRVGEEAEVEVEAENENDENLSKDDGRENSIPDIEEVDANVSINKTNQQDDEEDVLSDDRTQTAEKQKSPPQSQMDIDTEESENKIGTNDDTLDDTSKTSDVQDVEMKSVESTADASEKEKSTEISENDKQSKQSEDKFDQLFDNVRKSTDAEPMETEDADPDPFEKDIEESQDGDKDECGGDNILENRDEPDNSNQADNASQSELPDTENDNEIVETQSENVQEEAQGESADVCLIPDNDEELTGAEKEQAILARQNAEKEDAEKEQAENEATENTEADQDKDLQLQPQETQDGNVGAESVNKALGDILNIQDSSSVLKTIISMVVCTDQTCSQCNKNKNCEYRFKDNETGEFIYICEQACIDKLIGENHDKYLVRKRKFMIEDLSEPKTEICLACKEEKICNFYFKQDEDSFFICSTECYNNLDSKEPNKLRMKRNSIRVKNLGAVSMSQNESSTNEVKIVARTAQEAEVAKLDREASFVRRCIGCTESLQFRSSNLKWQSFDFCNQLCLSKYQQNIGSKCRMCFGSVLHPSLGKYCVRFGFEICQFCCASCLDKYKKSLKNCSYCQKDISKTSEGFLAPVGDNEQFKDFCSQNCMKKYDTLMNPEKKIKIEQCFVCNNKKTIQVNLTIDGRDIHFCSNPCFSAFKFVNNVVPDKCDLCSKYFERQAIEAYTIYNEDPPKMFCGKICFNMFITKNRKIVFCQWCKVKKYNFDMIERAQSEQSEGVIMCSLNCLVLYEVSLNRITKQKMKCDNCLNEKTPQYHLTMSDSSIRNFCTYQCVMQFQSQFSTAPLTIDSEASIHLQDKSGGIFPTGLPKRIKSSQSAVQTLHIAPKPQSTVPVISNITSLAAETLRKSNKRPSSGISPQLRQTSRGYSSSLLESSVNSNLSAQSTLSDYSPPLQVYKNSVGTMTTDTNVKTTIITVPPIPPKMSNKRIMCKPITQSKGVTCKPLSFNTGIQTDEDMTAKILIPVPVPIYVPQPMHMYSLPFPVPVPIPLPIPIPIFIPTTRNSAAGILKEIKKIHDKMPSDPFEAELLMMAEMVAGENKKDESDSDDDDEGAVAIVNDNFNNDVIVGSNNSYGEDVLQMALKMATEYDEPAVDLESAMTASTITQPPPGTQPPPDEPEEDDQPMLYQMPMHMPTGRGRGRKRGSTNSPRGTGAKRGRRNDSVIHQPVETVAPVQTPPTIIPAEKPDANMCLKYTFGVNAWKQWVMTKNAELEKSPVRRKPFKSELLQMTADELSYSLCLFVKEVRKPNGTEYAPDTIYYLVLGIQQYLYENGRIDNIFTDPYYERFTDCLDDVARKFSVLYNDSQYIVTRVEEEHLWECKQLGAHSPHVLLSTLMFFNTKHFNLTSVEEHMQLSFSHIMKHWKRSPQGAKQPGSRNVLLRFYPPQAGQDSRKKKVYEQQENEANPLRCPVRLYEFYLSKCPESVKTRNDVFYLQPERSCVPDSPVWYSTQPLTQESLQKMLHRVKMVKEINVAILNI